MPLDRIISLLESLCNGDSDLENALAVLQPPVKVTTAVCN